MLQYLDGLLLHTTEALPLNKWAHLDLGAVEMH